MIREILVVAKASSFRNQLLELATVLAIKSQVGSMRHSIALLVKTSASYCMC